MFSKLFTSILLLQAVSATALIPAKRQASNQNFQDLCGADGIDCGSGWCCWKDSVCTPTADPREPPLFFCQSVVDSQFSYDPARDYASATGSEASSGESTSSALRSSTVPTTASSGSAALISTTSAGSSGPTGSSGSALSTAPAPATSSHSNSTSTAGATSRSVSSVAVVSTAGAALQSAGAMVVQAAVGLGLLLV